MQVLRTARANSKPPSLWWGRSGKRWSDADRLLSLALTAYEDSLCAGCGQPKDRAYDPDAEGWFEVHEVTCAACKATTDHAQAQKQAVAGQKIWVADERLAAQLHDHGGDQDA